MISARPSVVVVGRYGGVVGVLTELLQAGGVGVRTAAALDVGGTSAVTRALAAADVVIVTATPADPTAQMAVDGRDPATIVAVTWHPDEEIPPLPAGVHLVRAGRIRRDLVASAIAASA